MVTSDTFINKKVRTRISLCDWKDLLFKRIQLNTYTLKNFMDIKNNVYKKAKIA